MFHRSGVLLAVFLCVGAAFAQAREVRVGILRDLGTREVVVMTAGGAMSIVVDGQRSGELGTNDGLRIQWTKDGLQARSLTKQVTAKRTLVLRASGGGGYRMKATDRTMAERTYPGSLEVQRTNDGLLLVAIAPLEDYVAGVVLSEAGKDQAPEYYKLQAVSCRTYALANQRRHLADGFEVCDRTHCQVFNGRNTNEAIKQAVTATKDLVVVDANIRLIHATFHSNCGGETMNAEDLWSKSEPYLVSTLDTFCLHAPHATWHRVLPKAQWLDYLRRTYKVDTSDPLVVQAVTEHVPTCREVVLGSVTPPISLEQVRADQKFNSAFFTIHTSGDQVLFDGRGFGHGIGMCQEGAMGMANAGLPFTEILHHYFADVHLVDLNAMDFFRDERH
ncbi:MAG: SpoIID/LytB domain-containing protein [Flavobacteriales bacterium]